MDKSKYFVVTEAITLAVVFLYAIVCSAKKKEFNNSHIIRIVLNTNGICWAFVTVLSMFYEWAWKLVTDTKPLIFLAGLMIFFEQGKGLIKDFKFKEE